jgi:hypothetical protein
VLEAVFVLLESPSPSRRIFISSHSLVPLWFVVSVLHILKSKMQVALIADEVFIQLGENVQMCIGTRAKPNVRVNLKENAKFVYDRQLSMSTCIYTKEPRHTLQFPQVQLYYTLLYKNKIIRTHMLYT